MGAQSKPVRSTSFETRVWANRLLLLLVVMAITAFAGRRQKPTLFIIGDSTVRNDDSIGHRGWGSYMSNYLDTGKILISNQAMAGRSTRTFIKEGRWDNVITSIKRGDFLLMQFGHNEGSVPDTGRRGYRGVLRGTGEDTVNLTWADGTIETVHSYGWYLKKFVSEAKAKGATVIIASMIPRNQWKEGKVIRATDTYGKWAGEVARSTGAYFVDLNRITADKYDAWGPEKVKGLFLTDHTHPSPEGARINAESLIEGIRQLDNCSLKGFIK